MLREENIIVLLMKVKNISKLAKHRVTRAMDVVSVGDIINVRVLDVDVMKKRISLEKI